VGEGFREFFAALDFKSADEFRNRRTDRLADLLRQSLRGRMF
jgi:hypothetical protein